jgi:thioredoxin reductase (NADPH)
MDKFLEHARSLGGEVLVESMISIAKDGDIFRLRTSQDKTLDAKAVMIATGTKERKLGIPGEEEFLGRGVSYCAICDGAFFKNKTVAVAGGGNSAVMAALMLAEHAAKVYLVHRNDNFRAEPIMLERLKQNPKVEIIASVNILSVEGERKVEKIVLDKEYAGSKDIMLDGLFIEIGMIPNVILLKDTGVDMDDAGHIIIDAGGRTNVDGLFAAGDVTTGSNGLRQILSASAEGMIATNSVFNFLKAK